MLTENIWISNPGASTRPQAIFALWPDKSWYHAPCGGIFSYVIASRSLVIFDGLFGEVTDPSSAWAQLANFAISGNYRPIVIDASVATATILTSLGWHAFRIGQEAVIDLTVYTSVTTRRKTFAYARSRFKRDGYAVRHLVPPHSAATLSRLEVISDDWLRLPGRHEQSFATGYFNFSYLAQSELFVLIDPTSEIVAFINLIPTPLIDRTAIDLIRYMRSVPSGAVDLLIDTIARDLAQKNVQTLSLGLAPLAGLERPSNLPELVMHGIYRYLRYPLNHQGLFSFKRKFAPVFIDRYVVYRGWPHHLPRLTIAALSCTKVPSGHKDLSVPVTRSF